MRASGAPAELSGGDPTASLWKGLAVLRFVLLAYALAVNLVRWQRFDDPLIGWLTLTIIAVWTLLVTWAYDAPRRRRWLVLVADLGVAVGALLVTPYVLSDDMLARHDFTLPTYWVAAPVLAWAIHRGWVGGALAGLVILPVDLGTRALITATSVSNMFLLLLAAAVVGYTSVQVRAAAAERARATELAARTAERERLARAVHDGVLQVLAYVQRRGMEIGGETAELARAAGEQEERLRNLIRGQSADADDPSEGEVNLGRRLASLGTSSVSVATPVEPVRVPARLAGELVAAVQAGLDNVRRHAPGAKAYVLLEHDDDHIVVSLRDDGPGIPPGRLEEAEATGRMGVSRSIVGRLADLGGSANLTTAPGQGTEWELIVPHPEAARRRRHEPA